VAENHSSLPPDTETRPSRQIKLTPRVAPWLTERLWLKIIAICLACLLWFIITGKEPTAKTVPVNFRPILDSTLVLRGSPPPIFASVQGIPSELLKLEGQTATIERQVNAQTSDTVIIDLSPDDVILPAGVYGTQVTDISPRSIRLEFERTLTRQVPVRSGVRLVTVAGAPDPQIEIEPRRVEISGPRAAVAKVAFVRTDSTTIIASDSLPHQVGIDTTGLGVKVKPNQVRVRLLPPRPPGG
jgi:hypothetical protein